MTWVFPNQLKALQVLQIFVPQQISLKFPNVILKTAQKPVGPRMCGNLHSASQQGRRQATLSQAHRFKHCTWVIIGFAGLQIGNSENCIKQEVKFILHPHQMAWPNFQ